MSGYYEKCIPYGTVGADHTLDERITKRRWAVWGPS